MSDIPEDVMDEAGRIARETGERHFAEFDYGYRLLAEDAAIIARAILAERERCAKATSEWLYFASHLFGPPFEGILKDFARHVPEAIRAPKAPSHTSG